MLTHHVRQCAWNKWHSPTMLRIVVSAINIKNIASDIAEQDNNAASIQQTAQQMKMCRNDTDTKCLRRVLIATMSLLLSDHLRGNALYVIQHIEQWIAEQLRKDERTDH